MSDQIKPSNTFKRAYWKVGEIAAETGLSVRALHHYDEIGLLKPAHEPESGHRQYTNADIERLHKIMTLKQLGFPLKEIKVALDDPKFSISKATKKLRHELAKRRAEIDDLDERLSNYQNNPQTESGQMSEQSTLKLIEKLNVFGQVVGEEERTEIHQHDLEMGEERMLRIESEWRAVTREIEEAIASNLAASDWRAHQLATRWMGLATAFSGGDLVRAHVLRELHDQQPDALTQIGAPTADLTKIMDYIERVLAEGNRLNKQARPRLVSHVSLATGDLAKTARFYERVLSTLDAKKLFEHPDSMGFGRSGPELWLHVAPRTQLQCEENHFGFWAHSKEAVDGFYETALGAGATRVKEPALSKVDYSCMIRDPEGNKVLVMYWLHD